jgi:hypothetical protein
VQPRSQAHPLDGCRLKLDRAEEHLQTLKSEILAYLERKPYRMTTGRSPDYTEHSFYLEATELVPPRFSVLFGDVLQNARSALDHIAWQLASLEHVAPRRTTNWVPNCPSMGPEMQSFDISASPSCRGSSPSSPFPRSLRRDTAPHDARKGQRPLLCGRSGARGGCPS